MATRVLRVDDLSGDLVLGAAPVRFGFQGEEYEIDLTSANQARLRAVFAPYIAAADRVRRAEYQTIHLPRTEPQPR